MKNKLEKLFSKSLKSYRKIWGMKLHNNPLAHQNTPADYFISWTEVYSGFRKLKNALIECKQVTCKDKSGRIVFKRLKQMHDLLNFASLRTDQQSYFCIGFYDNGWNNSEVYLIPAYHLYEEMEKHSKVSFNRNDMAEKFGDYLIPYDKGVLVLPKRWAE